MAERGEDYSSDNESDVALSLGSDIGEDSSDGRYKTDQRLVVTCDGVGVGVGVVIRSVGLYGLVKTAL